MNVYQTDETDEQIRQLTKGLSLVTFTLMETATAGVTKGRIGTLLFQLRKMLDDAESLRLLVIDYETGKINPNASGITTDTDKNHEETNN